MDIPIPVDPLLDFTPVPRKVKRPDGWTPERQRRFIELLAETGSPYRAAVAMGKVLSGIEAVYREPGAESFRSAWHRALEIADIRERSALAGMTDGPAPVPPHRRARAPFDSAAGDNAFDDGEGMDEAEKMELLGRIVAKFTRKVAQERDARLAGDVVGADFALRQVTCLEVGFDLMSEGHGLDAWDALYQLRRGGHGILQIGDTAMSRLLDDARRAQWEAMGEPPRPEHPPARHLNDHGDHRTEDRAFDVGEGRPGREEEQRVRAAEQAKNAKAQVEWESAQRRVDGDRRDSEASRSKRVVKRPAAARAKRGKRDDEHPHAGPAAHRAGTDAGFSPAKQLPPPPEEDFETRMMRKALEAARRAHPEDFD